MLLKKLSSCMTTDALKFPSFKKFTYSISVIMVSSLLPFTFFNIGKFWIC